MKTMEISIRFMVHADLNQVMKIEKKSFKEPWSQEKLLKHLDKVLPCLGSVAELRGEIIGYMLYERKMTELEIVRIVTHPRYRRLGVATCLVEKLIAKTIAMKETDLELITTHVPEGNLVAQLWLRKIYFLAADPAIMKGSDENGDTYVMSRAILH